LQQFLKTGKLFFDCHKLSPRRKNSLFPTIAFLYAP
jgi:hypothetical protein